MVPARRRVDPEAAARDGAIAVVRALVGARPRVRELLRDSELVLTAARRGSGCRRPDWQSRVVTERKRQRPRRWRAPEPATPIETEAWTEEDRAAGAIVVAARLLRRVPRRGADRSRLSRVGPLWRQRQCTPPRRPNLPPPTPTCLRRRAGRPIAPPVCAARETQLPARQAC
eukprot:255080-Prymnesium_polylepis.1